MNKLRILAVSAAAALALCTATGITSAHAQGATPAGTDASLVQARAKPKANTDTFSFTEWRYLDKISICEKITFSTKVTYTAQHAKTGYSPLSDSWALRKITVVAPKIDISTYSYNSVDHACTTKAKKVARIEATARIRGYACTFNPSLSVLAPFSVGVNFWPSCGDKRLAGWSDYRTNQSGLTMYRTDARVKFGDQVLFSAGAKPKFECYGSAVATYIVPGRSGQSYTTGRHKMCLSPSY